MEPQFATKLIFEDEHGLPFILHQPLVYWTKVGAPAGKINKITVPAGFKTDMASIPRFFWRVLPPIGRYDKAAVVHDYLYHFNGVTRKQADDILLEAMHVLKVVNWQCNVIYGGVRVGGGKPWNEYRQKEKQ